MLVITMKKNILLIISQLRNGGAERSITNLANSLAKTHNVTLVTFNKKDADYDCNVPIIEIPELKKKNIKEKFKGIRKLKKIKKELQIDVTISYTTTCNFYNALSKGNDRVIISIRNHLTAKNEGFTLKMLHKISTVICDFAVCCSESLKADQIKNFHVKEEKLKVINNFCDEDIISKNLKEKLNSKDEKLVKDDFFVAISRIVPHKGIKHIIKALKEVVKTYPKTKVLIFGRGDLKTELIELAKEYKIDKNVIFMDFYKNPHAILKRAKGFILASDYEGFPNVVIEAMACGVPVIATDVPGGNKEILTADDFNDDNSITEIKEAEFGILVPGFVKDHQEKAITKNELLLKDAMEILLKDPKKYQHYHKKSLERIKAYDKKIIVEKWLEIIK